jgi:transcriptional regulator with XRE-family HTH domain
LLDFGQNLLRIRTTKGLNQLKLAEMVGLSQASISQFEKGSRQPTPAIVKKIAKELDIPLEELVGEDGPEVTAAQHLMRNLKGLSPAAIEKINAIAEIIREAEIAKRQSKK